MAAVDVDEASSDAAGLNVLVVAVLALRDVVSELDGSAPPPGI